MHLRQHGDIPGLLETPSSAAINIACTLGGDNLAGKGAILTLMGARRFKTLLYLQLQNHSSFLSPSPWTACLQDDGEHRSCEGHGRRHSLTTEHLRGPDTQSEVGRSVNLHMNKMQT